MIVEPSKSSLLLRWASLVSGRPFVIAIAIQVISFSLNYCLFRLTETFHFFTITILFFSLIQGFLSLLISYVVGLRWWWLAIQFLFPVFVAIFLGIGISPIVYLTLLAVLLLCYVPSWASRVPFYPSSSSIHAQLLPLLPRNKNHSFIDIGSGFGGVLFGMQRIHPNCRYFGIELAPLPWLFSFLFGKLRRSSIVFKFGRYEGLNLAEFDVVFAYLSPVVMPSLWDKAKREMQAGSLLLSYEFPIPSLSPHITIQPDLNQPALFGWRI